MDLSTVPAFVLGNGPGLTALLKFLPLLRKRLSIGVNRILRSGFAPTVIAWVDTTIWQDESAALDAAEQAGTLLVSSAMSTPSSVFLQTVGGNAAWTTEQTARVLLCRGNTAVMAARWALDGLGCPRVHMLGCAATGRGDFYGENPWHLRGAAGDSVAEMHRELDLLLAKYSDRVDLVQTPDELLATIAGSDEIDEQATIREIRKLTT